jgi:spore germination protein GerM
MLYIIDEHGFSVRIYNKPNFVSVGRVKDYVGQDKSAGEVIYETRYKLEMFFDSGVVVIKSADMATIEKIALLVEGEYKVLDVRAYSLGEDLGNHWPEH